ncbi:MAG: hypothetical protein WCK89_12280 [bacterium]
MLRKRGHQVCVWSSAVLVVGAALVLYGVAVWFGNLNQDEGWYLYAARRVAAGATVYRDFFFTQGPLMPQVYALLSGLWSPYGVLGGRLLTACLGLSGCVLAALLARRAVPPPRAAEAGIMAFALTACNLYHVYFTTIPKTYALASCLLLGGYGVLPLCLSPGNKTRSWRSGMWALAAGLLVALAAGTRLSLGVLLPVTALWLLATCRKTGAAFFWFALGGGMGLAVVYGPVLLESREQFFFAQSFHAARGGHDLFLLVGSLARTVRAYLPACLLGLALVILRLLRGPAAAPCAALNVPAESECCGRIWPSLWLCAFLAVLLVQLASPYPYDDYQVPVMGLLVAALAGWAANSTSSGELRGYLCLFWVLAALLSTFCSPLTQEWFVVRQDRFWVVRKSLPDLALLRMTAHDVRALAEKDEVLLTQDVYLAVEAGMRVPEGLDMGPFSYFPALSDEAAARFHVMNKSRLAALLASAPCSVAAFSGYGLAIRSPVMDAVPQEDSQRFLSLLGRNYAGVQEVPNFGQNCTTLQILKRRVPGGATNP